MTHRLMRLWVLLLCGICTAAAFAQNANSTIKGTVQDASGAVVPGATVELTNVGTNQTLTTTSKADGFYVFTNLSPANYKVSVTAQGFAQWEGLLTLRVSQDAEVDAKLTAASVSTKVTVRDVTPVIDRVNPTISDVKNATAIETVPVANRNILAVLAFSPGVVAGSYGGAGAGNTRINGLPPGSVNFQVDGQSVTNRNTNELQDNPQPTPTFQELKVITSNGDAQYSSPGVVEMVTKSGTNHFHGQIYELNQNNHLQAKIFNQRAAVPYLQHNEYGFQVGGPVWLPKIYNGRNKTFFFVDMEWIKQNANQVEQYTIPTLDQRHGDLSTVFGPDPSGTGPGVPITIYDPLSTVPGTFARTPFSYNGTANALPPNRLNPVTQKVFGVTPVSGLVPLALPNIPGAAYWDYNPNYTPPTAKSTVDNRLYTFKVDQILGLNRLSARYTFTDSKATRYRSYTPTEPDENENGGHNGALSFTEVINPRMVNTIHVGIQYNNKEHTGPQPIANVSQLLGLPTYQTNLTWPQFYFDSYTGTDNYWTGIDRTGIKDYPTQTVSGSDQFSWNKGNHQMFFGFDYNNYRVTTQENGQPGGDNSTSGYFTAQQSATVGNPVLNTGSGLADFLLGDMNQLYVNFYPIYHFRQSQFDGYAQDNWRATNKLTVNLGLRYQYWTAFDESGGQMSTFDPNIPGGMVVYHGSGDVPTGMAPAVYAAFKNQGLPIESAAAAHYPTSLFNMPKNNWEPRVGFSYELNSKTVLRGGYGIYHFALPLFSFEQAQRANAPFSYSAFYQVDSVPGGNPTVAQLEFPVADNAYGGAQPINQYQLGNQGCTNQPAGTCNPPGYQIDPTNAAASIQASSNGWNMNYLDPNYHLSMVQEYNLTFGRELPYHTGFQLSYIGNHSSHLLMVDNINEQVPRLSCANSGTTDVAQCEAGTPAYRKMYPAFSSGLGDYTYDGYANTNELQAQLTHTFGSNLTLQSYFTWMKALTTSEFGLKNGGPPSGFSTTNSMVPAALTSGYNLTQMGSGAPASQRLRAVYANDPTLPAKMFQFDAHYVFPFGSGQRFLGNAHGLLNAVVSGYNLSTFFEWHSGFYFSPHFSQFNSVGPNGSAINLAPGQTGILPENQRNANRWFNSAIYDPTSGAPYAGEAYEYAAGPNAQLLSDYRNNIPLNYMTGPGFNRLDATVYKMTPIWKTTLDFEAQFLNIYNHQNLGMPNANSGVITTIAGGPAVNGDYPRTIQLQAKILF